MLLGIAYERIFRPRLISYPREFRLAGVVLCAWVILHTRAFKLWDWNDYVIKADGLHIQTWLNGVQGLSYEEKDPDIASDGVIGIQIHGGGNSLVQVKDVFIEELPPAPGAPTWESLGGVDGQRKKLKPKIESKPKPSAEAAK